MLSLYAYPIPGKDGFLLCEEHGGQLERKEVVLFNKASTEVSTPEHCWVCNKTLIRVFLIGFLPSFSFAYEYLIVTCNPCLACPGLPENGYDQAVVVTSAAAAI
jgi:hypothetical protein